MITGDPINDNIQWLLQELKQVDKDLKNSVGESTIFNGLFCIRYEI